MFMVAEYSGSIFFRGFSSVLRNSTINFKCLYLLNYKSNNTKIKYWHFQKCFEKCKYFLSPYYVTNYSYHLRKPKVMLIKIINNNFFH